MYMGEVDSRGISFGIFHVMHRASLAMIAHVGNVSWAFILATWDFPRYV